MSIDLRLRIADARFGINLPPGAAAAGLAGLWAPFSSGDQPDSTIQVELDGQLQVPPPGTPLTMPEVERLDDGSLRVRGSGFEARASADRRTVALRQGEGRFPLDSVLKVLLAERLLERGGLLLHSVGVAVGDRAACFLGESGAGKSTLGSLCAAGGFTLLADELVAVTPGGSGFTAFGTPWNLGAPGQAALRSIGSLAWDTSSRVEPAPPAELLRLLLPNAVMSDPSAEGRGRMFRAATALLAAVPVVKLTFARDASAAETLRAALRA